MLKNSHTIAVTTTATDAPQPRRPLAPLTTNVASPPKSHQNTKSDVKSIQTSTKLKTKKLQFPHPQSIDVLPSPTNKWSATTHPIKSWVFGYLGYYISYKHFYFHQHRVLHTKAFAPSTTPSIVGDGNKTKGSTELDTICGHNCAMTENKYTILILLALGLHPNVQLGAKRNESSYVNKLLEDFFTISNLTAVLALNKTDNQQALARLLACFSLLLLGADALTPKIIAQVWGQNNIARRNLGGPCGDLVLIHRQLISVASVDNNTYHLGLTTTFNGNMIITDKALLHLPPGIKDILQLIRLGLILGGALWDKCSSFWY
jgi:hypothetical protein